MSAAEFRSKQLVQFIGTDHKAIANGTVGRVLWKVRGGERYNVSFPVEGLGRQALIVDGEDLCAVQKDPGLN